MTPWTAFLELLFLTSGSRRLLRRWLPEADPDRSGYVQKLYGGFMLVRREILENAGWFDERYFMYAEDADLCRTVAALGWKLYYCSEAIIIHVGGGVTVGAPSAFSILMQLESINKLIAKHQGAAAALLHRCAVFIGGLLRLAVAFAARAATIPSANSASAATWKSSCMKQRQMVLWSLGLRIASVPTGPRDEMVRPTERVMG
jgi:GT2 family glycosyltransferase